MQEKWLQGYCNSWQCHHGPRFSLVQLLLCHSQHVSFCSHFNKISMTVSGFIYRWQSPEEKKWNVSVLCLLWEMREIYPEAFAVFPLGLIRSSACDWIWRLKSSTRQLHATSFWSRKTGIRGGELCIHFPQEIQQFRNVECRANSSTQKVALGVPFWIFLPFVVISLATTTITTTRTTTKQMVKIYTNINSTGRRWCLWVRNFK